MDEDAALQGDEFQKSVAENDDLGTLEEEYVEQLGQEEQEEIIQIDENDADLQPVLVQSDREPVEAQEAVAASTSLEESDEASSSTMPVGLGRKGYVFWCSNDTQAECHKLHLFGSPTWELHRMKANIVPEDTLLFLLNFNTLRLMGPFLSFEEAKLDIVRNAFKGNFRAQVRVAPLDMSLLEARMDRRIACGPKTVAETETLVAKLWAGQQAPANLQEAWCSSKGNRTEQQAGAALDDVVTATSHDPVGDVQAAEGDSGGAVIEIDDDADENEERDLSEEVELADETTGSPTNEGESTDDGALAGSTAGSTADRIDVDDVEDQGENENWQECTDEADVSSRNGFVFVCSKITQKECQTLKVLGSPEKDLAPLHPLQSPNWTSHRKLFQAVSKRKYLSSLCSISSRCTCPSDYQLVQRQLMRLHF
jgi:hypothetical protein